MDYAKQLVATLRPYDISASKLILTLGKYGAVAVLLLGFAILVALKLRLLAKFGLYLGSVGILFLALGAALLFNTPLLLIGNFLILAGNHSFQAITLSEPPTTFQPLTPCFQEWCWL